MQADICNVFSICICHDSNLLFSQKHIIPVQDCIAACMGVINYLIWRVTIRYDNLYYQQVTLKLHAYVVAHPNLMQCIPI